MKIIPVMDLLNKTVVHAIKGQRQLYQPLKSQLFKTTNPIEIAKFFEKEGFKHLYIADLDAILNNEPNNTIIKKIAQTTTLNLMVDGGINDLSKAQKAQENNIAQIVVGTETLTHQKLLLQLANQFDPKRIVVSLDIKNNKVLSKNQRLKNLSILEISKKIEKNQIQQIILLDLDKVGSNQGVNTTHIKQIQQNTNLNIMLGGGVRNLQDLIALKKLKINGVLLATALHHKQILISHLQKNQFIKNNN